MKARAVTGILTLGALAALAFPTLAGASARSVRRVREPGFVMAELHLRGSKGFDLELTDLAGRGANLSVVSRNGPGTKIVDYSIPRSSSGDPSGGSINVRVGRFGHFRGHMVVSSRKSERSERGCTGRPTIVEDGVFVGSFHFRGEEGYTKARRSRAHGSITRRVTQTCTVSVPKFHPGRETARHGRNAKRPAGEYKLLAADLYGTYFEAERRAEKQVDAVFTDFAASVSRRVGDLGIDHYGSFPDFGTDTASVFQIPDLTDPLSEAVLTPPAPFSGSATFRSDGARSGTWTGDLEVRLPGLPATPLTGDDIEAGLCVGDAGCTETLPKQLQPVLEAPPGTIVVVGIKKKTRRRTVRKVSNK